MARSRKARREGSVGQEGNANACLAAQRTRLCAPRGVRLQGRALLASAVWQTRTKLRAPQSRHCTSKQPTSKCQKQNRAARR